MGGGGGIVKEFIGQLYNNKPMKVNKGGRGWWRGRGMGGQRVLVQV